MRGPGPRPIFKTGIRGQAPPKLDDPVVTTEFPKTGKSVPGKKTFGRQSLFLGKDFGGMDNLRMAIWKFFVLRQTLALSKEFRPGVLPKEPPSCFPTGLPPCSRPGSQRRIPALPPEAQHPPLLRLPDRGRRDSRPLEEGGVCQSFEPAFGGIDAVRRLGKRIKAWNRSVYDPNREGQRSGHCGMIRPDRPVVRDESGFRPREVSRIILGKGSIHGLF